jgi:hypothetical protein
MRSTYRVLAGLVALGVVAQASFIAGAWFGVIKDIDDGAILDENYEGNLGHVLHGIFGQGVIPLLALLLLIVAFFAKVPRGVMWAGIVLASIVVQVFAGILAHDAPYIGMIHGLNAFVLFSSAGYAARLARTADAEAPTSVAA